MLWPMVVLRADPWNPDFGMGFEPVADDPLPHADPFVETDDWTAPAPTRRPSPPEVWFVDGVRRVEVRLLADDDGRRVPGLFGSYAVGSVRSDGAATFEEHRIGRALVVGGGVPHGRVDVPCGRGALSFEGVTDPRDDPNGPIERLQALMRQAEDGLAARVAGQGATLVLADGPLRLGQPGATPIVGVVKRFVRHYLDAPQDALLARLDPGERTPLFALSDREGAVRGYSWYARVSGVLPAWHDHAGLVRCEVRAGVGLEAALEMAQDVTALLPRFAGRGLDPRTPQNLAPVAGLEGWLRHRMGDRTLIRRALLDWLAGTTGI